MMDGRKYLSSREKRRGAPIHRDLLWVGPNAGARPQVSTVSSPRTGVYPEVLGGVGRERGNTGKHPHAEVVALRLDETGAETRTSVAVEVGERR